VGAVQDKTSSDNVLGIEVAELAKLQIDGFIVDVFADTFPPH
jgi:hypothetical protein